ncbi:MAG: hypothetical protein ACI8QI_002515 [Limisphaerales bacterium]|jgi:hypothetical protein
MAEPSQHRQINVAGEAVKQENMKKGGQRLLEMARRKSPPAIEEAAPVRRYTDSNRFEKPILHDVGPVETGEMEAPPPPKSGDFIGRMFPRLSAAVNLFGQIDVSGLKQKRGEAGMKKFDESVGTRLMDDVLLGQLSDLENRLSLAPKLFPRKKAPLVWIFESALEGWQNPPEKQPLVAPLQGAFFADANRWCRCAQPPANGCHASGVIGVKSG